MSIDKKIDDLIAALDRNTAALAAAGTAVAASATAAPAAKADKKEAAAAKADKKEAAAPKITQEEMQAALIKVRDDFGSDVAKALVREVGKVEKMSEIKPALYQTVFDAAVAKHAELSGGPAAASDDGL